MFEIDLSILIAGVLATAAPIVLATIGETLTEKAGIINLSLDGSILLSAMTAFVVAYRSGSLTLGFLAGATTGAMVAAIVAVFSIQLQQSQVAVGFVLTLMTRELAYFLGNDYARLQGPQALPWPIPVLSDLPLVGPILFAHTWPVYASFAAIGLCWWFFYATRAGLNLRAVGEHPAATYMRGLRPQFLQLWYTICGGALVGLAGATFSLATKPGWGRPQGAEGTGWIALALVIFGGWHPLRAAAGAYLFAFLQVMGIYFQTWLPSVPAQVFQVAPFPLMIFTLLLLSWAQNDSLQHRIAKRPVLRRLVALLGGQPPAGLGKPYRPQS